MLKVRRHQYRGSRFNSTAPPGSLASVHLLPGVLYGAAQRPCDSCLPFARGGQSDCGDYWSRDHWPHSRRDIQWILHRQINLEILRNSRQFNNLNLFTNLQLFHWLIIVNVVQTFFRINRRTLPFNFTLVIIYKYYWNYYLFWLVIVDLHKYLILVNNYNMCVYIN